MAMEKLVLTAQQIPGHSTTVTRYLATATCPMIPRRAYLLTDTTLAAHASNGWVFDLQKSGSSFLTSSGTWSTLTAGDGGLTGGTAVAFGVDTTKRIEQGDEITLVMTIQASGADQSNSRFAVTLECEV